MADLGGRLCVEDQLGPRGIPSDEGVADVQGAEPGGASVPPPEGSAGGGPDVPEEPGADRGAALHPGLGVDGAGLDGAAGASRAEGSAAVRSVPRGSSQPGADGPLVILGTVRSGTNCRWQCIGINC